MLMLTSGEVLDMRHIVLAGKATHIVGSVVGVILVDVSPMSPRQLIDRALDNPR